MKKADQKIFVLPAAILELGGMLSNNAKGIMLGRDTNLPSLSMVGSETTRILSLVRPSVDMRKILGIHSVEKRDDDGIRLQALAYLAWQSIAEGTDSNAISEVAYAVMLVHKESQHEQLLLTRDCLARMVRAGLLKVKYEDRTHWDGKVFLPQRTFSYLCGGMASLGDFLPSKISAAGRDELPDEDESTKPASSKIPTAKELYDEVRSVVIGIDPQVKVLASRFALHVARADAIKAGVDDNTVGQMVVCLVGSSGASKSYLASRMAKSSGLPYTQFDATTLTASGYVGSDLDDVYKLLVGSAGGNATVASRGVCFLDEFDKKSTRYGRDVNGEAVQMELLSKLQATSTPFLIGGKRSGDFGRQFPFDGRPTGYILAGVFSGLDEEIEKMEGRKNIGFACQAGGRQHIRITDCLKELGFLDELVNRIGLVMRLPDPTMENVMRATSGGILDGFNAVLASKNISILLTSEAVRAIGDYAMLTRGFYRSSKSVLATLIEEVMYDPPKAKVVVFSDGDVRRAVQRLSSGFVLSDDNRVDLAASEFAAEPDGDPDGEAGALNANC